jgi:hypothetical protein
MPNGNGHMYSQGTFRQCLLKEDSQEQLLLFLCHSIACSLRTDQLLHNEDVQNAHRYSRSDVSLA